MPRQRPGLSEQSVGTPVEFVEAACRKLYINWFNWDLAASAGNTKVSIDADEAFRFERRYFNEADDALRQPWHRLNEYALDEGQPWSWLNPPFGHIAPWARKCCEESQLGAHIAMLVPASIGANWWSDYVQGWSFVLALRSRIQFIGHDHIYPKDLALCLYTPTRFNGLDYWDWQAEFTREPLLPRESAEIVVADEEIPF